jgi:hypothetical protein
MKLVLAGGERDFRQADEDVAEISEGIEVVAFAGSQQAEVDSPLAHQHSNEVELTTQQS